MRRRNSLSLLYSFLPLVMIRFCKGRRDAKVEGTQERRKERPKCFKDGEAECDAGIMLRSQSPPRESPSPTAAFSNASQTSLVPLSTLSFFFLLRLLGSARLFLDPLFRFLILPSTFPFPPFPFFFFPVITTSSEDRFDSPLPSFSSLLLGSRRIWAKVSLKRGLEGWVLQRRRSFPLLPSSSPLPCSSSVITISKDVGEEGTGLKRKKRRGEPHNKGAHNRRRLEEGEKMRRQRKKGATCCWFFAI